MHVNVQSIRNVAVSLKVNKGNKKSYMNLILSHVFINFIISAAKKSNKSRENTE